MSARVGVEVALGLLAGLIVYVSSDRMLGVLAWVGVVVGLWAVRWLTRFGLRTLAYRLPPTA